MCGGDPGRALRGIVGLWPLPSSSVYFWHLVPDTARLQKNEVETQSSVGGVFLDAPESPVQQLCGLGVTAELLYSGLGKEQSAMPEEIFPTAHQRTSLQLPLLRTQNHI